MTASQIEAVLFGLALGDALCYPVEFMSLQDIRQKYSPNGIQNLPVPAYYSDDTQMTIALAEGILDARIHSPIDNLMQSVGKYFIKWLNSPDNNRAPGTTCITAVKQFQSGISWREAGIVESKGCGSAMRVAPLGYIYQYDEDRLREVSIATSQITHRHPTAIAATVAAAYLVKLALDAVPISTYMSRLYNFVTGLSDEFDLAILRVGHVLGWANEDLALDHIGQGWTGEEAVALALNCVLRYPDNYLDCIRRAANTNGDSDSIACIAGGVMGARLGLSAVPHEWRTNCENATGLSDLAQCIAFARSD